MESGEDKNENKIINMIGRKKKKKMEISSIILQLE